MKRNFTKYHPCQKRIGSYLGKIAKIFGTYFLRNRKILKKKLNKSNVEQKKNFIYIIKKKEENLIKRNECKYFYCPL